MLQALGRAEKALSRALVLPEHTPERFAQVARAGAYRDVALRWVGIAEEAARNR